jgi:hypothetical protein
MAMQEIADELPEQDTTRTFDLPATTRHIRSGSEEP